MCLAIDDLEIFRWLVSLGARSDDPDVFFQMIWKTESDSQFEMLRILFQQGHSPNITSHKGSIINEYTPLSWCLAGRGEDLDQKRFKFLLDHGADPSLRTQPDMPNTFEYAKKFPWALNILRARVFAELNT